MVTQMQTVFLGVRNGKFKEHFGCSSSQRTALHQDQWISHILLKMAMPRNTIKCYLKQ